MKSSQSNFDLRSPSSYLARSYLIATIHFEEKKWQFGYLKAYYIFIHFCWSSFISVLLIYSIWKFFVQSTNDCCTKCCSNTKVSFFVQCTKMQLITLQNFNIRIGFSQFLWFFSLKWWFKGQLISMIPEILSL